MAFLTIAGTNYEVLQNGATEGEPEKAGASRRTWDGTLRSTVGWQKRNWTFTLLPMSQAAYEVFYAAVANAAILAISGTAMPTGGISAEVNITGADYIGDGLSHLRVVTIKVIQA